MLGRGAHKSRQRGGYYEDGGVIGSAAPVRSVEATPTVAPVLRAIERQTALIQEGFSRRILALINWNGEDAANLQVLLQ